MNQPKKRIPIQLGYKRKKPGWGEQTHDPWFHAQEREFTLGKMPVAGGEQDVPDTNSNPTAFDVGTVPGGI